MPCVRPCKHARPGPRQAAFQKHNHHEYDRHLASDGSKEELHKAQGGSEEVLALTVDIHLQGNNTSAHTSGSPHGKGRVSAADAAWNLSFTVLNLGLPVALRCLVDVGLLTFCFFVVGGAADIAALRFLDLVEVWLWWFCLDREDFFDGRWSSSSFRSLSELLLPTFFVSLCSLKASTSDFPSTVLVEILGLVDKDCVPSKV